jgi:hypothetical protein
MNVTDTKTFIEWLKQLLLDLEDWFHNIQAWLEGGDWPGRVLMSAVDAAAAKEEE